MFEKSLFITIEHPDQLARFEKVILPSTYPEKKRRALRDFEIFKRKGQEEKNPYERRIPLCISRSKTAAKQTEILSRCCQERRDEFMSVHVWVKFSPRPRLN